MVRLPPFIALRALEAAARHRSYSKAAAELNVTHGAVSQQIRRLEETFGARLFVRQGNAMEPTPAAARLAARIAAGIEEMQAGVAELATEALVSPLVISTVHAMAGRWLMHRLARLPAEVGEIEIQIDPKLSNFVTDGVDCAIRHGSGPWSGVEMEHLFSEHWFPVCSPDFLARHPIRTPADIAGAPLLHHIEYPWSLWFTGMGLETPKLPGGPRFDDSVVLVDAAVQGLGLALAREFLVEHDIATGRLVRPLPGAVEAAADYTFVWRADAPKLSRVLRLRDWLLEEAARLPAEGRPARPAA
ncbi:MAG: LysR substrate-binding domain-containing protein [Pseudomonadota bacterium]